MPARRPLNLSSAASLLLLNVFAECLRRLRAFRSVLQYEWQPSSATHSGFSIGYVAVQSISCIFGTRRDDLWQEFQKSSTSARTCRRSMGDNRDRERMSWHTVHHARRVACASKKTIFSPPTSPPTNPLCLVRRCRTPISPGVGKMGQNASRDFAPRVKHSYFI